MGNPIATPGVSSAANAYQTAFNTAYYASKPPAFQPLYAGRPGAMASSAPLTQDQTWTLIGQLIAQGWTIDEEIDAESMDPYTTMFMRELYGNTWEPAGLGAASSTTVLTPSEYSGPVPAGQIAVSTLISDYPPYPVPANGPVTPPTPQAANPVGVRIIAQIPSAPNYVGDVFRCAVANDGYAIGESWTGTSGAFTGTWTKQALEMGVMIVWTKTT
jgi:hypothetical protein